jgi:glycerol-3-phosphate acyltransferase PlsX
MCFLSCLKRVQQSFAKTPFTKIAALIAYPVLKAIKNRIDPRLHNGASFLGLKGLVIKSHGGADALAFKTANNQVDFFITSIQ